EHAADGSGSEICPAVFHFESLISSRGPPAAVPGRRSRNGSTALGRAPQYQPGGEQDGVRHAVLITAFLQLVQAIQAGPRHLVHRLSDAAQASQGGGRRIIEANDRWR